MTVNLLALLRVFLNVTFVFGKDQAALHVLRPFRKCEEEATTIYSSSNYLDTNKVLLAMCLDG